MIFLALEFATILVSCRVFFKHKLMTMLCILKDISSIFSNYTITDKIEIRKRIQIIQMVFLSHLTTSYAYNGELQLTFQLFTYLSCSQALRQNHGWKRGSCKCCLKVHSSKSASGTVDIFSIFSHKNSLEFDHIFAIFLEYLYNSKEPNVHMP